MQRIIGLLNILKDELRALENETCAGDHLNDEHNKKRFEEKLGNLFAVIKALSEVTYIDMDYVLQSAEKNLIKIEESLAEIK